LAAKVGLKQWLMRLFFWLPLWLALFSIGQVVLLRWMDPWGSSFMANRQMQAWLDGDYAMRIDYRWRDLEQISRNLPIAVVAAEDQRFPQHRGFDFAAIERAYENNRKGRKVRGASTLSQQLAKNLFLWSGRSYLRKGLEAWYTLWIEALWPKRRILEVYVNVVEFGDGVYGAEAASRRFFKRPAADLTLSQSARLAAVLPNPKVYSARNPGPYVQRRSRGIERQVKRLGGASYLDDCCRR
jgi:monofunctional biosynthetic peptidoglycan transglycosylase